MLTFDYVRGVVPKITPTRQKRMEKMVFEMMETTGSSGPSASGWTALAAIRWCQDRGRGFTLTVAPHGQGYYVQALPEP